MSARVLGRTNWSVTRDKEGHREYRLTVMVVTTSPADGPYTVLNASGTPTIGSAWSFGNDSDPYARCWPDATVTPVLTEEPDKTWTVEYLFSTRPLSRCQDEPIENPLDEPDRIGGSFVKYTEEAVEDKDGNKIKSSSHEMLRGAQVEFDANRPTVWIEQNVPVLELDVFSSMIDKVNDAPLWGLAKRMVKLSNVSWSRQLYGTCSYYFTRRFEFDVNYNTFDRKVIDEGTKVFDSVLGNDRNNPDHFMRYKDARGENARVLLDGNGDPLADGDNPVEIDIKKYQEANFLALGIPTFLG